MGESVYFANLKNANGALIFAPRHRLRAAAC